MGVAFTPGAKRQVVSPRGKAEARRRCAYFAEILNSTKVVVLVALILLGSISLPANAGATAGWSDPAQVAITDGTSESPSVVVDTTGKVQVVWSEDSLAVQQSTSADRGFIWSSPVTDASTSKLIFNPYLSAGAGGSLHLVWSEKVAVGEYDIFYSTFAPSGGTWSTASNVSGRVSVSTLPVVTMSAQGRRHVLWADKSSGTPQEILYKGSADGVTWSSVQDVSLSSADVTSPDVVLDAEGNLNAVWHAAVDKSLPVYFSKGTVTADSVSWASPIGISAGITGSQYARVAAKGNDIYTVWSKEVSNTPGTASTHDVYFSKWTQAGGWTTPTAIPQSRVSVTVVPPYFLVAANPDIAVDSLGVIHVVWHGKSGGDDKERIYYARSADGGMSWTEPVSISGNLGPSVKPSLALDENNSVYVGWQDYRQGTDAKIYFATTVQRVFLPLIMKTFAGGW